MVGGMPGCPKALLPGTGVMSGDQKVLSSVGCSWSAVCPFGCPAVWPVGWLGLCLRGWSSVWLVGWSAALLPSFPCPSSPPSSPAPLALLFPLPFFLVPFPLLSCALRLSDTRSVRRLKVAPSGAPCGRQSHELFLMNLLCHPGEMLDQCN